MIWLDKRGWPVEFVIGSRAINFVRWLLHASILQTIRNRKGWRRGPAVGTLVSDTQEMPVTPASWVSLESGTYEKLESHR
jgi:hypothetical protein